MGAKHSFDHWCIYQHGKVMLATGRTKEEVVAAYNSDFGDPLWIAEDGHIYQRRHARNVDEKKLMDAAGKVAALVLPHGHGDISIDDIVIAPCTSKVIDEADAHHGWVLTDHGVIAESEAGN